MERAWKRRARARAREPKERLEAEAEDFWMRTYKTITDMRTSVERRKRQIGVRREKRTAMKY